MADSRAAIPTVGGEQRPAEPNAEDERLDARLALAARDGDARAFESLLERHEARVLRLVRLLGVRHDDREDVAQEVFVRVFRHLARFRAGGSFGAWLYRITINAAHDHRVKAGRRSAMEQSAPAAGEAVGEPIDEGPSPGANLDRDAAVRQLEAALASLSERERAVFVLCRVEQLETGAVAKILGISRITVRRHLSRSRDRLRREMGADHDPEKKTSGR